MQIIVCLFVIYILTNILDNTVTLLYCWYRRKRETFEDKNSVQVKITKDKKLQYCLFKRLVKWFIHVYEGWIRYKLFRLGKVPCHCYRNFILRRVYLMKMAKTAVLYGNFEIRAPWQIEIGEGSIIGDESKLDGRKGLKIGKHVNFSTGVWIWTEQHDLDDPYFATNQKGGKVIIGDRAWISSRTIILPKVTIGEGCVVVAGAVITKDCEPFGIYGGIPGKKIGNRSQDLRYEFQGTHEAFL